MYFVTYQYASFSEAGILTADFKRVVPVTTIGKVLGVKLPEQMTDFIRLADDALIASIEKAMADIPGAYPLINREFIAHEGMSFPYVNREEDMGIEGLRKAKLSYRPVELTAKYRMEPLP